MTGYNMMVLHHVLAETFGKFWITNTDSAGSIEEDCIMGLPGLQK
jgi:hypothetical protein